MSVGAEHTTTSLLRRLQSCPLFWNNSMMSDEGKNALYSVFCYFVKTSAMIFQTLAVNLHLN